MNALSTLLVAAATTVGTVKAVRSLARVLRQRQSQVRRRSGDEKEPIIVDLVRDDATGVYTKPQ